MTQDALKRSSRRARICFIDLIISESEAQVHWFSKCSKCTSKLTSLNLIFLNLHNDLEPQSQMIILAVSFTLDGLICISTINLISNLYFIPQQQPNFFPLVFKNGDYELSKKLEKMVFSKSFSKNIQNLTKQNFF